MIVCPRCGSLQSPEAQRCGSCGTALGEGTKDGAKEGAKQEGPHADPPKTSMKRTMVGMAPLAPGVAKEPGSMEAMAPLDPGTLAPGFGPPPQPAFQPAATYQSMPEAPRRSSRPPPPPPKPQYSATIALVGGLVLAAG